MNKRSFKLEIVLALWNSSAYNLTLVPIEGTIGISVLLDKDGRDGASKLFRGFSLRPYFFNLCLFRNGSVHCR